MDPVTVTDGRVTLRVTLIASQHTITGKNRLLVMRLLKDDAKVFVPHSFDLREVGKILKVWSKLMNF